MLGELRSVAYVVPTLLPDLLLSCPDDKVKRRLKELLTCHVFS